MSEIVPTTRDSVPPATDKVVHPVRGVLWGLMFGIGLAGLLLSLKVVSFGLVWLIVLVLVGILAGVLWSTLGPPRMPAGAPPEPLAHQAMPEPSRFDDFADPPVPPAV